MSANPETAVIDAIDQLERDEIDELVDWQMTDSDAAHVQRRHAIRWPGWRASAAIPPAYLSPVEAAAWQEANTPLVTWSQTYSAPGGVILGAIAESHAWEEAAFTIGAPASTETIEAVFITPSGRNDNGTDITPSHNADWRTQNILTFHSGGELRVSYGDNA